jgi:DNA-binding protein YbaB
MRTFVLLSILCGASSFSVAPGTAGLSTRTQIASEDSSTARSLFGGKKDGDGKKGPGMMDQLGMLKKAQEVAGKKMAMDKELGKVDFVGESAGGKIKITVKYVPPLPMQQPSYEATVFDIDEGYLNDPETDAETLSADLSAAVKEAYRTATEQVTIKLTELTKELSAIMGDMGAGMPPPPPASA